MQDIHKIREKVTRIISHLLYHLANITVSGKNIQSLQALSQFTVPRIVSTPNMVTKVLGKLRNLNNLNWENLSIPYVISSLPQKTK